MPWKSPASNIASIPLFHSVLLFRLLFSPCTLCLCVSKKPSHQRMYRVANGLVLEQGFDPMWGQASAAFEELQFDAEQSPDHVGLEILKKLRACFHRSASSEQIVDYPDP